MTRVSMYLQEDYASSGVWMTDMSRWHYRSVADLLGHDLLLTGSESERVEHEAGQDGDEVLRAWQAIHDAVEARFGGSRSRLTADDDAELAALWDATADGDEPDLSAFIAARKLDPEEHDRLLRWSRP